jgi:hypothetical protein
MSTHELRTWPEPYAAMIGGFKFHETRQDDRGFAVGDALCLREWDPMEARYTGREAWRYVTYISRGPDWGLPAGMVVMSVTDLPSVARRAAEVSRGG